MRNCSNCGSSNTDSAKFCNDCGAKMPDTAPAVTATAKTIDFSKMTGFPATANPQRCADIMFVLDCTGSMQGEIDTMKETIAEFADTIKSEKVRARVGLIEFRDRFYRHLAANEEHQVLTFDGEVFTDNPDSFRAGIAHLTATGGADDDESSLDAVLLATRQPFRPDASKVIVLVTDAAPHIPDVEAKSVEEVVAATQAVGINQFYIVAPMDDPACQVYLQFIAGKRGMVFPLGTGNDFRTRAENFKLTLMSLGKTISAGTV
jgi:von Willebrand factor type A domain/zinc-ribbon domain